MADPVALKGKPNVAPTGVHAEWDFENHKIKTGWMIPVGATGDNNAYRWTSVDIKYWIYTRAVNSTYISSTNLWEESSQGDREGVLLTCDHNVWVRGIGLDTSFEQGYNRATFYPVNGTVLDHVVVEVLPRNPKGFGPSTKVKLSVSEPATPKWSEPEFDTGTSKLSCVVSYSDDNHNSLVSPAEWNQNVFRVVRTSSWLGGEEALTEWDETDDDEHEVEVTVPDAQNLSEISWVKIEFQAYSEGMNGSLRHHALARATESRGEMVFLSEITEGVSVASHVFAHPPLARIKWARAAKFDFSTGYVNIGVSVKATEHAPLDSVTLERLRDTTAATAEAAEQSSGWDTVTTVQTDAIDAFVDSVADAAPNRGSHTWYRVVTVHDYYTRRSTPVECKDLYRDNNVLSDDNLRITKCVSGNDGKSAEVTLRWDGHDWTGIELTWSEDPKAWESTKLPEPFDVTWASTSDVSTKVLICDLEEGTPYYIRARLYLDSEGYRQYGGYASAESAWPVVPVTAPSDVRISAPAVIERGREIPVSWTYQGEATQKAWVLNRTDTNVAVASGEDSLGACTLPASSYGSADSITLQASLTTGGEWGYSQVATVRIADAPAIELKEYDLTRNDYVVQISASVPSIGVAVAIRSLGAATATPDGELAQPAGEVIWSTYDEPPTFLYDGEYLASIEAPRDLPFIDGCRYVVTATATDLFTGLASEEARVEFGVNWARKAELPASVTIVPDQESLSCLLRIMPPESSAYGDVFDLYRVTPNGAQLCGKSLSFYRWDYLDAFAPASSGEPCAYRVCTRTTDGSLAWADYTYELESPGLRLDWGEESVTLPYNIDIESGFTKDFELRRHLDGTSIGCWNAGSEARDSASSQIVKELDSDKLRAVLAIGNHAGPVFVRTPDGSAYAADVQPGSVRQSYSSGAVDIALSITRIPLPDSFGIVPVGRGA